MQVCLAACRAVKLNACVINLTATPMPCCMAFGRYMFPHWIELTIQIGGIGGFTIFLLFILYIFLFVARIER